VDELVRRLLCLPERGSTFAAEIDHLHYSVIGATMLGAIGVALAALWFILRYGREGDVPARTRRVRARPAVELGVVGALLALFLLWFQMGFDIYARMTVPPADATVVYVVAKQWMWQFESPGGPPGNAVLYVPERRPVKLLITSRDVVHSFFVPAFRLKQDAVPGRFTEAWFEAPRPGTFDIFCAEYCGTSHSTMRGQVVVLPAAEYERWLAGRDPAAGSLAEVGRRVAAERECLRCHTVDGTPHLGPTWKDLYGRVETMRDGARVLVDEAYITESMMDPLAKVVAGYEPTMPTYRGRIDAPETAAVIEYMKTLSTHASRRLGVGETAPGEGSGEGAPWEYGRGTPK
jgi:cytochrome c oxidase subunit 2